jgi:hypothetical protein
VALGKFGLQRLQRQAQAVLRQGGGPGQGGVDIVQAGEVTPDQAGRGRGPVAAQLGLPGAGLQWVEHGQRQGRWIRLGEDGQQRRLPAQGVDGEVAGHRQLAYDRLHFGSRRPLGTVGMGQAQPRKGAVDQRGEGFGQGGGGLDHAEFWHPPPRHGHDRPQTPAIR